MHIANYFLQGEVSHGGLPQWIAEHTGLYGGSPEAGRLVIWINSNGGDVLAAIEAANLIKASPIPVTTIVNGAAESAALLISMVGHRRYAFNTSWGMAHHFSTSMEGSYHELQDSVRHNELLNNVMVSLFKEHSKASDEEISTLFLGRKTSWLSSKDLLKHGLVDEILAPGTDLAERILSDGSKKKTSKKAT